MPGFNVQVSDSDGKFVGWYGSDGLSEDLPALSLEAALKVADRVSESSPGSKIDFIEVAEPLYISHEYEYSLGLSSPEAK